MTQTGTFFKILAVGIKALKGVVELDFAVNGKGCDAAPEFGGGMRVLFGVVRGLRFPSVLGKFPAIGWQSDMWRRCRKRILFFAVLLLNIFFFQRCGKVSSA